jgi:uncharacterized SAM-dependent methyltransferase
MRYYKNSNLSKIYKVSEDTIARWIKSAEEKNLNLQIYSKSNRSYILNTSQNHTILAELAEKSRKFKNKRYLKSVTPKKDFYNIYNDHQIIDIIKNIELYREIPLTYIYFGKGAKKWDEYYKRNLEHGLNVACSDPDEIFQFNKEYLFSYLKQNAITKVNLIDIGCGNAFPLKNLVNDFLERKLLRKYIALDASIDILQIAKQNLISWFGQTFPFEQYLVDINTDYVSDLLFNNTVDDEKNVINIIFFVGGTIENQHSYDQPLRIIKDSMRPKDLFILHHRLDSPKFRLKFSFDLKKNSFKTNNDLLDVNILLNLLNIQDSYYDVERVYDEMQNARLIKAVFKYDIDLTILIKDIKKQIYFQKGESLIFFRFNHHNLNQVIHKLNDIEFSILQLIHSVDEQDVMFILKNKA